MTAQLIHRRRGTSRMLRRLAACLSLGAALILASATAVSASAPARTVNVLLDVRAEWGRTLSACVTEGVFFGFHSGTSRHVDNGATVTLDEDTSGVWWWQTDVCDADNSFFHAADVHMDQSDFYIDRQLESAWANVEIPLSDGTTTYLFSFDLTYTAAGTPSAGVSLDPPFAIRQDRAVPVEVTGVPASTIPMGFDGMTLAWADMGTLMDQGVGQ